MTKFKLKPLSASAIPDALEKARCFRFLGEPLEAESICRDILAVEPDNGQALSLLLLAMTDQFDERMGSALLEAQRILDRFKDPYSSAYYRGILHERRAKAHLKRGGPGSGGLAYEEFRAAMAAYEEAEKIRLPGDDDAVLRWNTCARTIQRIPDLGDASEKSREEMLE